MANRPNVYRPRPGLTVAQRERESGRASSDQRGYDHRWRKLKAWVLNRDGHLCQECKANGQLVPTNLVDHIVPIAVAPELRLVAENCQALCVKCNTRKYHEDKQKYGAAYKPL